MHKQEQTAGASNLGGAEIASPFPKGSASPLLQYELYLRRRRLCLLASCHLRQGTGSNTVWPCLQLGSTTGSGEGDVGPRLVNNIAVLLVYQRSNGAPHSAGSPPPHIPRNRRAVSAATGLDPWDADARRKRSLLTVKRSQWGQPARLRADQAFPAPRDITHKSWRLMGVMYLWHSNTHFLNDLLDIFYTPSHKQKAHTFGLQTNGFLKTKKLMTSSLGPLIYTAFTPVMSPDGGSQLKLLCSTHASDTGSWGALPWHSVEFHFKQE